MPRPRPKSTEDRRRRAGWFAVAAAACLVVSACSESGGAKSADTTTTSTSSTTTTVVAGGSPTDRTCDRAVEAAPAVEPVAGAPADRTMTSFDGAKIRLHWFPTPKATEADPAPTVLEGPGWGQSGSVDDGKATSFLGSTSVHGLREAGYNVLTWDPRGFGKSTGTVDGRRAATRSTTCS